MKVLIVNVTYGFGSTGRICKEIADIYRKNGNICKVAYGRGTVSDDDLNDTIKIGNRADTYWHGLISRLFNLQGHASKIATLRFIKKAEAFSPDVLWLHNIHGYYLNYRILFDWIKSRSDMEVKWTLHDTWAFTGHCTYFTMYPCDQWKTHCTNCIQKHEYPKSILFDTCYSEYNRKKAAFSGIKNLTIYTPSQWLADFVKQSFLKSYPIEVKENKVDKSIFKFTENSLREKLGLTGKKVLLGVANIWDKRKGLEDFISLFRLLPEDYKIVLVGLSPKQISDLPSGIIGIERTKTPQELAAYYSTADLYINPSKEETFGMTTLEAASCGTKSIVYSGSASQEIAEKNGGIAVQPDVQALYHSVVSFFECADN